MYRPLLVTALDHDTPSFILAPSQTTFMFDEEDLAAIRSERERWADETLEPFLERGERKDDMLPFIL